MSQTTSLQLPLWSQFSESRVQLAEGPSGSGLGSGLGSGAGSEGCGVGLGVSDVGAGAAALVATIVDVAEEPVESSG